MTLLFLCGRRGMLYRYVQPRSACNKINANKLFCFAIEFFFFCQISYLYLLREVLLVRGIAETNVAKKEQEK